MSLKRPGIFLKTILYLLIFQLAFPYPVMRPAHASAAPGLKNPIVPIVPNAKPFARRFSDTVAPALADPLIETLRDMPEVPFTMGLSPNDPTLDSDPFFLRGQKWIATSESFPVESTLSEDDETESLVAFKTTSNGFTLQLRGKTIAWEVTAPLHPIYFTGDYVVLAANDPSFFDRTKDGELHGQGVFLVTYDELLGAHARKDRVPVYFFPLPGDTWAGKVEALAFPAQDLVVLAGTDGDTLPIQEQDIHTILSAAKMNLALATAAAVRSLVLKGGNGDLLPLPGSTAGFGLLFTGFNLDHPELDIFTSPGRHSKWMEPLKNFFDGILGQKAFADDNPILDPSTAANQKLVKNLIRVATVTGIAFAAAVVLKYTLYREHFKKKHENEPKPGFLGGIKRTLTDIGDIFAHNLTVLSNVAKVWFGNGVEFIIDRFAPSLGAGKNSLTRKFLEKTVYFSRDSGERLPVNTRTFLLGTGILGMVDSGLVAVQLYFIVPWIAQGIAQAIPALKDRVDNAFDVGNPNTDTYNRNEVIRNLAAYIAAGASTFSGDLKSQLLVMLGPEVDNELRKRGLDPSSPSVKAIRDARLNELLTEVEKQVGLPGKDEFLFDATTMWAYGAKLLGYASPEELQKAAQGGGEVRPPDTFQAAQRPGLLAPAVKRALKEAKKRLADDPFNASLQSAVKILEETSADIGFITNFVKYPTRYLVDKLRGRAPPSVKDVVEKVRRTRQNLLMLTYDGPLGRDLRNIPGEWTKVFGESGARLAGQYFRYAFFSLLGGDKAVLTGPTDVQRDMVAPRVPTFEREAIAELKARYPDEYKKWVQLLDNDVSRGETRLRYEHRAEYKLLVDEKIVVAAEAEAESRIAYKPLRKGFFARWQERSAKSKADKAFVERFGAPFNAETATGEELTAWRDMYSLAMMNQVGLYPDYEAVPKLKERVEQKALELTDAQLKDPKVLKHVETFTAEEKIVFASQIYAENVTQVYREIVVNSPTAEIPATSTAQPGRLQRLRQTKLFRNSGFLTRAARAWESLFPVEAHRTGLLATFQRNVPGLYDLMIGNLRIYRNAVTSLTAIYWFNYFVWGVSLPLPLLLLNIMTGFMIASPAQFLTRFFRMQGMQPMGKVSSMALYAFIYSWATFWGSLPTLIFADDFTKLVTAIQGAIGNTLETPAHAIGQACSKILSGGKPQP